MRAVTATRVAYRDGVPMAAMEGDYVRPLIPLTDVAPALVAEVATRWPGVRCRLCSAALSGGHDASTFTSLRPRCPPRICAAPRAGAQDKERIPPRPPPRPSRSAAASSAAKDDPDRYTLEDKKAGAKYRLTGVNVRDYIGQRVQIVGGVVQTKRLTIKGGLTPNANVAAQAGAMDPARAAVAAAGGAAGPGTVELPEFRVKSVRPVSGGCPD